MGTSNEDAGAPSEDTVGASEPIRWGRVVAGLVIAVLAVLLWLAAIPLFIWALIAQEVCILECNPVEADARWLVGFVGGFLVIVGTALLAGASRLLSRKTASL